MSRDAIGRPARTSGCPALPVTMVRKACAIRSGSHVARGHRLCCKCDVVETTRLSQSQCQRVVTSFEREWTSKGRLQEVLWHQHSLAQVAKHVAVRSQDEVVRSAAREVADFACSSAVSLRVFLPRAVRARVPRGSTARAHLQMLISSLGDRVALMVLASAVAGQARRLADVADDIRGVDDEILTLIESTLVPEHDEVAAKLVAVQQLVGYAGTPTTDVVR